MLIHYLLLLLPYQEKVKSAGEIGERGDEIAPAVGQLFSGLFITRSNKCSSCNKLKIGRQPMP